MSVAAFTEEYARVSRAFPCPVCDHDSWCVVHESGTHAICQRVTSDQQYGGAGWRHDFDEPVEAPEPEPTPPADPEAIAEQYAKCVANEQVRRLSEALRLPLSSLVAFGVRWDYSRRAWAIPMHDDRAEIIGLQYRTPRGDKFAMAGSRPGLFLPARQRSRSPYLFVCEGLSDAAAVYSIGLNAIGRQACHTRLGGVAGRRKAGWVVLLADNDDVGLRGAIDTARDAGGAIVLVPSRAKDAREAVAAGCTQTDLTSAIRDRRSEHWQRVF